MIVHCLICKQECDTLMYGACRLTLGWVPRREQGGPNVVYRPRRYDQWAHKECVAPKFGSGGVPVPTVPRDAS